MTWKNRPSFVRGGTIPYYPYPPYGRYPQYYPYPLLSV